MIVTMMVELKLLHDSTNTKLHSHSGLATTPFLFNTHQFSLSCSQPHTQITMDTAIDLSDASKALDLANIRFQLMYTRPNKRTK